MIETYVECADDGNNVEWKDGRFVLRCESCPWKGDGEHGDSD